MPLPGNVLPNARILLAGGKIMALARSGEPLPEVARDAPVIDSKGLIYHDDICIGQSLAHHLGAGQLSNGCKLL